MYGVRPKSFWHNITGSDSTLEFVCGAIAAMKGRNPLGWGLLGLFFSILTLIVVIIVPLKK
jgi:hypothetical protein